MSRLRAGLILGLLCLFPTRQATPDGAFHWLAGSPQSPAREAGSPAEESPRGSDGAEAGAATPAVEEPAAAPDEQPAAGSGPPLPAEPERLLPDVDFYFPEGELDFRLNGLIKGSFYEGQVRYDFVDGDIRAFLRYRYYGEQRIFQLEFFDSLEFESLEKGSNDFERVRGGFLLLEWPRSFHQRTFLLAEVDRISSNKEEFRFTTNRTNTFLRLAHQIGTPNDLRSNSIVGNPRAVVQNLFTAHRSVGPYGAGLTAALTWGFDFVVGDFDYLKAEIEALKRFNVTPSQFLIGRINGGTFLAKSLLRDGPDILEVDRYSIPRGEFFRLDGRENLKGLDEKAVGTEELHVTGEYFFPWFLGEDHKAFGVGWQNWYWVLYGGYGTVGFDRDVLTDADAYVTDVGFGFESSFRLREYTFFLSGILAYAIGEEGDVKGRFSIKSHR